MKTVKILNLVQGTDEWLEARKEYLTASEAPAMMGDSKYKSRTELLKEKKTGKVKAVSSFTQSLFDKGHQTEESARDIIEFELMEEFKPVVGSIELDGLKLLASLDGLSEDEKTVFEHKLWNEILAENVNNSVLEASHYWQLEFQLMVFGAESVLFVVSDGTTEKRASFYYVSIPERREKLIKGLKQFAEDLKNYEVKAKQEVIVANEQESFPVIQCSVEGSMVVSNLGEFIPAIKAAIDEKLSVILETDQDFADTEAFVKNIKTTRTKLKQEQLNITNAFESYSAFVNDVSTTDGILQQAESKLNLAVKTHKEAKKLSIINNAEGAFNQHLRKLSESINDISIGLYVNSNDWAAALKGKRSFEKMEEAVNSLLANAKIEASEVSQIIRKNLDSLTELAKDHKFLFSDHSSLILKDNDDLINLIKMRISEHEQEEAERKRLEKEKIEFEAKQKAEREAAEKLELQEQAIRDEERKKVEAEQKLKEESETKVEVKPEAKPEVKLDNSKPYIASVEDSVKTPVKERLASRFADVSDEIETCNTNEDTRTIPQEIANYLVSTCPINDDDAMVIAYAICEGSVPYVVTTETI
ncbi:MAG: YqaJ viral recombinase family protein [Colwellia sp.]|nr:YqaJ viral recombinase family protein [Colwellia sp.]